MLQNLRLDSDEIGLDRVGAAQPPQQRCQAEHQFSLDGGPCIVVRDDGGFSREHPPTETMNRVAGEKVTSAQDARRQQQGQPTAAQQAEGAVPSAKMADQGC
jgi:hypothetical protein